MAISFSAPNDMYRGEASCFLFSGRSERKSAWGDWRQGEQNLNWFVCSSRLSGECRYSRWYKKLLDVGVCEVW